MKIDFRCVESINECFKFGKMKQVITQYTMNNGKKGTEIITDLGQGYKGIRTIEKDTFGNIEKVIDDFYGRKEIYTSAFPIYPKGIFQFSKDGFKMYFPDKTLKSFDI